MEISKKISGFDSCTFNVEVIKGVPDDDTIAEEDGDGTMEVVDTLEVVASNNDEVDVRFEIGDWRLEVGENDESNDPNEGNFKLWYDTFFIHFHKNGKFLNESKKSVLD